MTSIDSKVIVASKGSSHRMLYTTFNRIFLNRWRIGQIYNAQPFYFYYINGLSFGSLQKAVVCFLKRCQRMHHQLFVCQNEIHFWWASFGVSVCCHANKPGPNLINIFTFDVTGTEWYRLAIQPTHPNSTSRAVSIGIFALFVVLFHMRKLNKIQLLFWWMLKGPVLMLIKWSKHISRYEKAWKLGNWVTTIFVSSPLNSSILPF